MNAYTTFIDRTETELRTSVPPYGYDPFEVRKGVWAPRTLQPFGRYLIFLAPPTANPWTERRISTKELAYTLTVQILLLVKNYNEENTGLSVFGDTAPDLGVFQLMSDVKDVLRGTDLGGFLDRTYNETTGGSGFESGAATGFETGEQSWVHRAQLTYTVQTQPFCFP